MTLTIILLVIFSLFQGYNTAALNTTEEIEKPLSIIDAIFRKINPGLDYLGVFPTHAATSCKQIAKFRPTSPSGFYWIQVGISPKRVFCNMDTKECGGGVWTRIADFNMTIPSTQCPDGLEKVSSPKRACRKASPNKGFSTSFFSTFEIPYSKVCGQIIGYQFGSPDAFKTANTDCHAEGVLLSYNNPREHIWTFTAQPDGLHKNLVNGCPCRSVTRNYQGVVPRYVGDDYFCETGQHTGRYSTVYYTHNPLWDGKGCGTFPSGCEGTRDSWFMKSFPYQINSNVEMRVCFDEPRSNEDVLIESIQMYVQ